MKSLIYSHVLLGNHLRVEAEQELGLKIRNVASEQREDIGREGGGAL